MKPAPFPRTSRSLAADRSWRVIILAALGTTALGAWMLWAAVGRVELAVARVTPTPAPIAGGGAGPTGPARASFPPAVQNELETVSLGRWLLGGRGDPPPVRRGP